MRTASDARIGRAEVRRRNLITADEMPYETPLKARSGAAITYDSGDYMATQAEMLAKAGWDSFARRQAEARAQGRYIGMGLGNGLAFGAGSPFP